MAKKTRLLAVTEDERKAQNEQIEQIFSSEGQLIAYIVRSNYKPEKTEFITPNHLNHQVGFIVYPKDGVIKRHEHRPIERRITETQEVLFVRSGQVEVELFSTTRELVTSRVLEEGDVLILVSGGHGFRMLKDTVFLEIKQGPYVGVEEKEHF